MKALLIQFLYNVDLVHIVINIIASFITRTTKITVKLPEVECEDGSKISPLKVTFPEGQGQYLLCWFLVIETYSSFLPI